MNTLQTNSTELVRRINEIFHDIDAQVYSSVHEEIFTDEVERWNRLLTKYLPKTPKTIIDFGCGTGFLESLLKEYVQSSDSVVCMDISIGMLEVAQKNTKNFPCAIEYQKIDGDFPNTDEHVDIILLNSVLHHIPNYKAVLTAMVANLKPGGRLFIGHEPNARFIQSWFLRNQYRVLKQFRLSAILVKIHCLFFSGAKKSKDNVTKMSISINKQLLSESLISVPLTPSEIESLIDIHSYTAGGLHMNRGFDCTTLFDDFKDECTVLHIESYNHISKVSKSNILYKMYDRILRVLFPHAGSLFFTIVEKK